MTLKTTTEIVLTFRVVERFKKHVYRQQAVVHRVDDLVDQSGQAVVEILEHQPLEPDVLELRDGRLEHGQRARRREDAVGRVQDVLDVRERERCGNGPISACLLSTLLIALVHCRTYPGKSSRLVARPSQY